MNNKKVDNKKPYLKELLSIDTLNIELDSISLDVYEQGTCIFEYNNSILFAGYNKHSHSIDWFDLIAQRIINHTFLERQGPNQIIGDIHGLFIHNMDSIFINDGLYLSIIDVDGKLKLKIRNEFPTEFGMASLTNSATSKLYFYAKNNSIIGKAFIGTSKQLDKTPLFLMYNLKNNNCELIFSPISEYYMKYSGFNEWINVTYKGDSILYTFTSGPDIYIYDLRTNSGTILNQKSNLSKNKMSSIYYDDPEALWKHYIENPRFFQLNYLPESKVYFRLHWKESQYKISNDQFITPYDKTIIISIFNEELSCIGEFELPLNTYLIGYEEITSIGLIINANNPKRKDYDYKKMELHIISLKN